METTAEQRLDGGVKVCTSREHSFGTDALLLADFASPGRTALACDLGTGCGIIPLYWASRRAGPSETWGIDIQEQAAAQFRQGIEASGTAVEAGRLHPLHADLRQLPDSLPLGRFDLVTCNPPYQAGGGPKPALHAEAVARHELLCGIGDVCAAADRLLKFGGRLCICQRPERLCDVLCAMRARGLEPKVLRFVAKEAGETPWLFLAEAKKGAHPGMRVLPLLAVYENGGYSQELRRIYGPDFGGNAACSAEH